MCDDLPDPVILRDGAGEPAFAVLSWRDWLGLIDRLNGLDVETEEEAAAEDRFARAAFAEARAIDDGFRLPFEVLQRLRAGGHVIAELRRWRGWDQAELARRVNTTPSYISQIETGGRRGARKAAAFAEALDVPEELIKARL